MSVTPELSVTFTSAFGPARISWGTSPYVSDLVIVLDNDYGPLFNETRWTNLLAAVVSFLEGCGATDVTSDTITVDG
jgi:hypothetical protein